MASNLPYRSPPPIIPRQVGIALIVANDYRGTSKKRLSGTAKDAETMFKAFNFLGYHTILKQNISRNDFLAECELLASYNYGLDIGCKRIAVVFSGHGDVEGDRGILIMQDEQKVMIKYLVDIFKPTAKGNHSLTNTARMFFIDACRGDLEEPRVVSRSPRGGSFINQGSSEAGILIAYSTTEHHKAYEGYEGGFWIQFLAQEMCTLDESLSLVLTSVNRKLNEHCNRLPKDSSYMQTAQFVSQLIEEVYLLRERPVHLPTVSSVVDEPLITTDQLRPGMGSTAEQMDSSSVHIKEILTEHGITCQYHIIETPSQQPSCYGPLYSCELTCHSNGMNYKYRSRQSYSDREDAKQDVNEQAKKNPIICSNEIFSRSSSEDHISRVDQLADYCRSEKYRPPSYSTKHVTNGCYVTTVLVPRHGKFEGEVAESIEQAKEKAARKALVDLGKIVDNMSVLL